MIVPVALRRMPAGRYPAVRFAPGEAARRWPVGDGNGEKANAAPTDRPAAAPSEVTARGCPLPWCLDAASHVHVCEVAVEEKKAVSWAARFGRADREE